MGHKADTVWDQILRRIMPPSDIRAYADWSTGIIRVNTTQEAWRRLVKRGPNARLTPAEQELCELFVHEAYHVVQFFTTSYLYDFATQLTVEITDWLRSGDFASDGEHFIGAALTAAVPAELSASIRHRMAALDKPGPKGVTTRSIVESAAFLVQKRTFDEDLPHAEYVRLLDASCPSPEYREAYDVASMDLGEATVDAYPLLASLALCTLEPATAFVALCAEARHNGLISLSQGGTSVDIDGLLALVGPKGFLGAASNLAGSLPFMHPIYGTGAKAFKMLAGSDIYKTCAYMLMPHLLWTDLGELVLQLSPFVFNAPQGGLMLIPPGNWSARSEAERKQSAYDLVAAAAIGTRVMEGRG